MLFAIKEKRQELSKSTEVKKKSQLGQFFTPERIAVFMANLFADVGGHCCLLDAGAGIGALSAAFLDRWLANNLHFDRINVEAFEIDQTLHASLSDLFKRYRHSENFNATIFGEDFIHKSAEALCDEKSSSLNLYTHAILNPPYKKLHSHSAHRLDLRRVGIETVNLYSAFVALAIARLAPGGQIVAIIPRSFCNEPYYRPFRHFILGRTALRHLHLFESRSRIDVYKRQVQDGAPCSADFSRQVLQNAAIEAASDNARWDYSLRKALPDFICQIPVELLDEAGRNWPIDQPRAQYFSETVARVIAIAELRKTLHRPPSPRNPS